MVLVPVCSVIDAYAMSLPFFFGGHLRQAFAPLTVLLCAPSARGVIPNEKFFLFL